MASQTHSTTEGTHEVIEVPPGEHGAGFPPFDSSTFASQILWLAITFGLFYWIMKNVAVPRIAGILEDRKDRIAGDLAEANRLKQETDAAIAAYEQALAEARNKAHGIAHDT
ncbi:MAG: ATP F0F1 synthase subunit B, partial [Roseibium sp.]